MAYGDHQVANVATEIEARTIGAPLRQPALDSDRLAARLRAALLRACRPSATLLGPGGERQRDVRLGHRPDARRGAGRSRHRPAADHQHARRPTSFGVDPHDTVIRQTPVIRAQIAEFLKTGGTITDPCGLTPCYAAGWTGP